MQVETTIGIQSELKHGWQDKVKIKATVHDAANLLNDEPAHDYKVSADIANILTSALCEGGQTNEECPLKPICTRMKRRGFNKIVFVQEDISKPKSRFELEAGFIRKVDDNEFAKASCKKASQVGPVTINY